MFGKPDKKRVIEVDGKKIELQDKPSSMSKLFGAKPAAPAAAKPAQSPIPSTPTINQAPPAAQQPSQPKPLFSFQPKPNTTAPPQTTPTATSPAPGASQPYSAQQIQPAAAPKPRSLYFFPKSTFIAPKPSSATKPIASTKIPSTKPSLFGMGQKRAPPKPTPTPGAATMAPTTSANGPIKAPGRIELLIDGIGAKHPALEMAMRKQGMKQSVYEFIKRIIIISCMFAIVIGFASFAIFSKILSSLGTAALLALMLGFAVLFVSYNTFLNFPNQKGKSSSKQVERDILFAARDLIIALRSGMPLFNAITSVSSGYGEASKEFLKIVEKVQIGTPLEDAIDKTVEETKSPSFRKIMLQASVSIRVGADVTSAVQSVIDQLAQERVIELRRYGQRLNAIAMFYMLFGIIVPSMGIAVLTILTTFIPLITINMTILEFVLVGITFLQVVFLQMIRSSRPVFTL